MNRIIFGVTIVVGGLTTSGALLGIVAPITPADERISSETVPQQQQAQQVQITVPEGFAIEEVYPAGRLGQAVSMVFDEQGRLVVGRQNAPVITLIDADRNGSFDSEIVFHPDITNAQGLAFDGYDLLAVAEGPQGAGLYRVVDADGDGTGERVELIEQAWGIMEQHGAHGIYWGPDGYLYWTLGNASGLRSPFHPLSPLRFYEDGSLGARTDPRGHGSHWRAPGGIFARSRIPLRGSGAPVAGSGGSEWELFAGGFRNQYDGVFSLQGELFTFDSDMEWDLNLPWYKGVASVHVVPGGDFAWRSGSMNHPRHYIDHLPPMADLGRGSPTGVTVLQTYNYPVEYWDVVLQSDWSRGRVVAGRLEKNGATYSQTASNFISGQPLNVSDLEVGPDGNLYFTLGPNPNALYRVIYRGPNAMARPTAETPIDAVLTMIQPRSSYSRALARRTKAELGERTWQARLTAAARDARATPERRVRALELLQVYGPTPDEALLGSLATDPAWEVRSAAAYYLGMKTTDAARTRLAALVTDADAFVQRRALEGLLRTGIHPFMEPVFSPARDILPLLASPDRFVRYQARHVLVQTRRALWQDEALAASQPQAAEALMAVVETMRDHNPRLSDVTLVLTRSLELLRQNPSEAEMLPLVRVVQRAMLQDHGVTSNPWWAPHVAHDIAFANPQLARELQSGANNRPNAYQHLGEVLLARFPARDTLLSRELARTLVAMGNSGIVERLAAELENPSNTRTQQIFYADQLSFASNGWNDQSIDRLANWLERVWAENWRGGASFGGYINYIREGFVRNQPQERYAALDQRLLDAFRRSQPQVASGILQGAIPNSPLDNEEVFEGLVYGANAAPGNPAAGVVAFEQAGCVACHTFGPLGNAFGPDLTTIGQRFDRRALVRKILFPHESVNGLYPTTEVIRNDGTRVIGIARDAGNSVVVSLAGSVEMTIPAADIRSRAQVARSVMPEGLIDNLNAQARRNLLTLLLTGPEAIPDSVRVRLGGGN